VVRAIGQFGKLNRNGDCITWIACNLDALGMDILPLSFCFPTAFNNLPLGSIGSSLLQLLFPHGSVQPKGPVILLLAQSLNFHNTKPTTLLPLSKLLVSLQ
jgi:hypothetical protein